MTHSVITFAHRGARLEYPENTLRAFRAAREAGASGLETDVWLSGDGEVVCTHDASVRKGARRSKVASTTAAELAERFEVPRLADVYEELGNDFDFSVDVKTDAAAGPLLDVARKYGALHRLWACTPSLDLARELRTEPDVRVVHSTLKGYLDDPVERHAHNLAELGIDAMNFHHTEWTAGLVSLFHRFGVRAFAWDTQEVRHLRAVLRMKIDAVYCDRPDRMVATVSEWITGD